MLPAALRLLHNNTRFRRLWKACFIDAVARSRILFLGNVYNFFTYLLTDNFHWLCWLAGTMDG